MTDSANPRSPESGEMPEWVQAWIDRARESDDLAQAEQYAGYRSPRAALQWAADALSSARERADRAERAEQEAARRESDDSARLEFLQDEHDRLDPVVKLVAKRDFDRNNSEWVEIVDVIETLDAARQSTPTGATNG